MKIIYFTTKRLLDILASVLGLIILAPLFLFIALWIKKDS
ncbi:TPA: sugar transferase, partial [Providencia alcalifaciens]|nr:sugar transferase [Providencia alcalifaciens]